MRLIMNAQRIRNNPKDGTFEVLSVEGKEKKIMKTHAEPTEKQIEEQIERFLRGLNTEDLQGNPTLQHTLLNIYQRYFTYQRIDHNGQTVYLKRSFSVTEQGDIKIEDQATKMTERELESLTVNNSGAPPMPKPRWNADGSPDFRSLDRDMLEQARFEGVPEMPRPRWNRDGSPSFDHLK